MSLAGGWKVRALSEATAVRRSLTGGLPSQDVPDLALPDVRVKTAPGGHLGVLTGRSARLMTWRCLDQFLTDYDVEPGPEKRPAADRAPAKQTNGRPEQAASPVTA